MAIGNKKMTKPNTREKIAKLLKPLAHKKQINIALAGGSGSGKSTIAKFLQESLDCPSIIVTLDKFFKEASQLPQYYSNFHQGYQADYNQPNSLKLPDMLEHIQTISGYKIAIFDGHFALYYAELRQLMDIKIFINCSIDKMLERRTNRNLKNNYGGSKENIFYYNQECVKPSYFKYILASKKYADIIINNNPDKTQTRNEVIRHLAKQICNPNNIV